MSGPQMFARYAYAPNALGYCGPADAPALAGGTDAEIRAVARRFSGAWPYLRVLSSMTGIGDPLDPRLVESYWLGGGVGAGIDRAEFLSELLSVIGPIAGGYWRHLGPELAPESAPNHNFHVFGIYPWTRLLDRGPADLPLRVLDNCRISWARVCARDATTATVSVRRLRWSDSHLSLSAASPRRIELAGAGIDAADVEVGDHLALHWDHICGRLDPTRVERLEAATAWQLAATNRRLDPHSAPPAAGRSRAS
ncbi:hypothetical protein A5780_22350 [Nocardia sp. 852002-20019_SCH5090214]|jgi:hypothetical protein|uniref:DUF6390 family protein n=1 Tax=Nocardia TaxID=1817 RepID=UPI0007EAB7C3|nr:MULTISPECIES: DUF6390 family protein [Nocardia]OBA57793.1 hypothetical protein A5780_22350 [Nocardia sp. 852002-20019_SCH5090214]